MRVRQHQTLGMRAAQRPAGATACAMAAHRKARLTLSSVVQPVATCADAATQTEARALWRSRARVLPAARARARAPAMSAPGGELRTTSAIAQGILDACRGLDDGARIAYVGVDDQNRTTVRLRAGAASSVTALQRVLRGTFPLARVATSENVLDGTVQAQIVVPSADDEWRLAYAATRERRVLQLLQLAAGTLACVALLAWGLAEPPDDI